MRNLNKPPRYNVASIQAQQTLGGDMMESNENGIWIEFRDYLRLLEDYKSLQDWKRDADAETLKYDSGDWFASKTLPERIKHIIDANAFSNDQWKDVDAENARLKALIVEMDKTINASQAECRRLKAELTDLKFTADRFEVENSILMKETARLLAEVDSLMTNPTSRLLRTEREENARKIHGLQQDNETLQNRVDFLEG
jgi:chromosome segregation ATPase